MATRIITDSAADFDLDTARRRKISVVPMTIQFGSAAFLAGKNLSNDTFFQLLQEGRENPSTSQPAPAAFLRLFEEAKAAGDQVVAILLSGSLSGTLQSAEIAKGMCDYEPIYIVDSRSASAGMQILVNLACKLRDSGLPAAAIAEEVERQKGKIRIFAVIVIRSAVYAPHGYDGIFLNHKRDAEVSVLFLNPSAALFFLPGEEIRPGAAGKIILRHKTYLLS